MKKNDEKSKMRFLAWEIIDPDFENMWEHTYSVPREIHFERDIFEVLETIN